MPRFFEVVQMPASKNRVSQLAANELRDLVMHGSLTEEVALEVLRHPYCTVEIAEKIADEKRVLASIGVRHLLCETRGFPFSRAIHYLATLPWVSLLELIASAKTPPVIKRQAERRLLLKLPQLALGEKVAMARRSPRPFFKALIATRDNMVLSALLDNGRLVENDILIILNTADISPQFCRELASHQRWGQYRSILRGMVVCPNVPYVVALSILVLLGLGELEEVISHPKVGQEVKNAAEKLIMKRKCRKNR